MKVFSRFNPEVRRILHKGGVGVIPTDTIYGIVGSALSPKTVAKIYRLRRRRPDKPMIILIGSKINVRRFGVRFDLRTSNILNRLWPGKVSIILPLSAKRQTLRKLHYLHRGTNTLAFRLPAKKSLREFLKKTGPLVAPSANFEGRSPAKTIGEARKYFGSKVDFYVDAGKITGAPSKIVVFQNGKVIFLRK